VGNGKNASHRSSTVEIGTGFFVEKSTESAREFVNRKMEYVKTQMTQISAKLDEDLRNLEQVSLVIRQKGGQV
jgi:prefoldin subunit 5